MGIYVFNRQVLFDMLNAPRRDLGAFYFFIVVPVVSFILLNGWPLIGLEKVDTSYWGGALLTIVVATVGIVAALIFAFFLISVICKCEVDTKIINV